jgi:probable blue pigment (indigoidine) exporter
VSEGHPIRERGVASSLPASLGAAPPALVATVRDIARAVKRWRESGPRSPRPQQHRGRHGGANGGRAGRRVGSCVHVQYLNAKILNMKKRLQRPGLVALVTLAAPVSWGTTYVTVTETLPTDRPLLIAAVRVTPAAAVLLAVGARRGGWRPAAGEWGRTVVLSMANFGAFFPLLTLAATRLPGGIAAAAGGLQPFLVAGLTWFLVGEPPRRRNLVVGAVAAVGVALVVVRPGAGLDTLGIVAAVASALSFAVGVVLTRRAGPPADPVSAAGWQLALSAFLLVPLALAVEGAPPMPSVLNLAGLAYLSLVGTALAYLVWFRGVRLLPAAAPPLLGMAAPVTGVVAGWAVLGQSLAPAQLMGFALVLGSITYGTTLGRSTDRPISLTDAVRDVERSSQPRSVRSIDHVGRPYSPDERVDLRVVAPVRARCGAGG